MNLALLGLSHHTAPVELREQFAIPEARLRAAVEALLAEPGVEEGLILSTCNRVEVLAVLQTSDGGEGLWPFARRFYQRDLATEAKHFYQWRDAAAVRHVFRVAASLDSLVVGEPQILGQYKAAYNAASAAGGVQGGLRSLLTRAFSVAKRIRTETGLARQSVSVSHAAVDLAKQIFGNLSGKTILLVGAGDMGAQAANYLLQQGASRLLVTSRTLERARALAAKHRGEAIHWSDLLQQGHRADVIISCTGAPEPLLGKSEIGAFLSRRKFRPVLLLDIAVPRDIAPEVQELENAFLYNIDDLKTVVDSHLADRQREGVQAEALIEAEVGRFLRSLDSLDAVPTIRALQAQGDRLRQLEIARQRGKLAGLTPAQLEIVEDLTRSLMQKWLHRPITEIKAAAAEREDLALLEGVAKLFGLEEAITPDAAPDAAEETAGAEQFNAKR